MEAIDCARCRPSAPRRWAARLDPEGAHLAALGRIADLTGSRVLEVGCGDGRLTAGVARLASRVLAFDPDGESVERAQADIGTELAGRVTFLTACATDVEIAPGAHDAVLFSWSLCCMEVGVHLPVLLRLREALAPGGLVLDLQVVPPPPRVEAGGRVLCEIDAGALFERAAAAREAVDRLVAEGLLEEEAADDHDVLLHYSGGPELVQDWSAAEGTLSAAAAVALGRVRGPCRVRERCRLRRLRRTEPGDATIADVRVGAGSRDPGGTHDRPVAVARL
jgi:SAM-dependent methyltransferase